MNHCLINEKEATVYEEEMSCISLVCPKPRRICPLNNTINDTKAGMELLDIILSKGGYGTEHSINHVNSSPPFFYGSPPSRAMNPLVQDTNFGEREFTSSSPLLTPLLPNLSPSPSPSTRKVGCARTKFGPTPAAVRVEGFDCLNRDRRNCSVPAVA